ncbi:hypothetical protein F4779DRAFT_151630 [Xylariaceae sp. FL0662B]|nr:hypothetical protein F4779DRAFT_151630 [Xylariaceae sp. FL0662B]
MASQQPGQQPHQQAGQQPKNNSTYSGRILPVKIGPEMRQVDMRIHYYDKFSPRMVEYLSKELPKTPDGVVLWKDIEWETFCALLSFASAGSYPLPPITQLPPLVPPPVPANEVPDRRELARRAGKLQSINHWFHEWKFQSAVYIKGNDKLYWALARFAKFKITLSDPSWISLTYGKEAMMLHARLFVWANAFGIKSLMELTNLRLSKGLQNLPFTYESAGDLCDIIRFVYANTGRGSDFKGSAIRKALSIYGALVGPIFSAHPEFCKVMIECGEFTREMTLHHIYYDQPV